MLESDDLLARENEFKKLNKQLEKKTEILMKEIEQVMQRQDIFSEFAGPLSSPINHHSKRHYCDTPSIKSSAKICGTTKTTENGTPKKINSKKIDIRNVDNTDIEIKKCVTKYVCEWCNLSTKKNNDLEFLYAFVSVNVKDNVLPQSFLKGGVNIENVCKFLSAKLKLMQEQIDKLQANIDKMGKQCESHMTQLAGLESERLTLVNKANNLRSENADLKAKYAASNNRINEKDRLYKEQRSLADKLTNEAKSLRYKNANVEARCAAHEETIATLKQQLEASKMAEKEFRDATRNLSASHQNAICRLEAKVKCLTTRIDKQMALIDNLKKQNALLATEGALKALERDYYDFLNSDL
ncbi:unnamed protein product [Pieris macdunnoughi]|uniref:Testis-expressed protein 9 n=1 Tax=Pieris macdunnoughi TaxID=345717 RepID=A0A821QVS8_9NEOP|nr:unnamed protein product [Pieris macdunnoughi]